MRQVSVKRQAQLADYYALVASLKIYCGCRSELSGKKCFVSEIQPHHIRGRRGKLVYDPFNIILLADDEHLGDDGIQKHNTWERKQELLAIVKPIRISQGFKEEGKHD